MACGCPVLSSHAASLPEVVGDAGLLLDPRDAASWSQAIIRVLADRGLQDKLRAAGPAQAARFSWEETARRTLEVYQSSYENRHHRS
jgi:glycosyltransferase involved in cell wall biosynthesis